MRAMLSAVPAVALLASLAGGQEREAPGPAALAKAFREADAVFTATVGKVRPLGMTDSIPASLFGQVTFKNIKPLRGAAPASPTFSYSYREGATEQMDLMAAGTVVVAARQKGVSVVVPATEANLALARKTLTKE